MSDKEYFKNHEEVKSLNKPELFQLKRMLRAVKRMEEQDKPQKKGAYLALARKVSGSVPTNEKIVHSVFGKEQALAPAQFKKKLFDYEIEPGPSFYVKPEIEFQDVQRLVLGKSKDYKTLTTSIYSEIYEKVLEKFQSQPDGDNIVRKINRFLHFHFNDAASFIRYTKMNDKWIHIDAFQTDFFNQLKSTQFKEPELKAPLEELRKHEDEFFKAAFSYIVRTNPGIKIWSANTEDIVRNTENVQGEVKLKEYYYKLPKALGFKLIPLEQMFKILGTRPPKLIKMYKIVKKPAENKKSIKRVSGTKPGVDNETERFKSALSGKKIDSYNAEDDFREGYKKISKLIASNISSNRENSNEEVNQIIEAAIASTVSGSEIRSLFTTIFHQLLPDLMNKVKELDPSKNRTGTVENFKLRISIYLTSGYPLALEIYNKQGQETSYKNIWWANRGMLFEDTLTDKIENFLFELIN